MSEEMFNEAVRAFKAGQRRRARDLFARVLKTEPDNVQCWLWMSAAVETEKEQVFCLQKALKLDPNAVAARRGLVMLGAMKYEDAGLPPAPTLEAFTPAFPGRRAFRAAGGFLANPRNRELLLIGGAAVLAVVMVGALLTAIFAPQVFRPPTPVAAATRTPPPPSPTPEPTVTPTPQLSPTPCAPPAEPNPAIPLAVYLCVPQTPVPLPVATANTPSEDYARLVRLYTQGLQNPADTSVWPQILERSALLRRDQVLSRDPSVYFFEAEAYRYSGQPRDAIASYREALDLNPNLAPAQLGKALAELATNAAAAAQRSLDAALAADPNYVDGLIARAQFRDARGELEPALEDLERARNAAPESAEVAARLATAYARVERWPDAVEAANQALALDRSQVLAYFARGWSQTALGDYVPAAQDLALSYPYLVDAAAFRSLYLVLDLMGAADLYAAEALTAWGMTQAALGQADAALTALDAAIARRSDNLPLAYLTRGQVRLDAGQTDEARADFETTVTQWRRQDRDNPRLVDAYLGLGATWLASTPPRADRALGNFQDAAELAPSRFDVQHAIGRAHLANGDPDEAIAALTTALGLAQTPEEQAQAYWERARAYATLERTADELADLQALTSLSQAGGLAPTAEARLTELARRPTQTATATATATLGAPATRTGTPTRTLTPTSTRTPTRTLTRTPTPVSLASLGPGYPGPQPSAATPGGGYPAGAPTSRP